MTGGELTAAEAFGSLVYELREDAYLTQAQLAAELGVSQAAISRWEHGRFLPNHAALGTLVRFGPGYGDELLDLWRRGRWDLYHKKQLAKLPKGGGGE